MASIFRKSYATTVNGKRVTKYARKYSIKYKDEHGQWRTKPGTTDKILTKRMAANIEYEVDRRRNGHIDPFEAPSQEALGEHLEAYRRFLEAKERCSDHVERTIVRIQAIFSACGFTKIEHLGAYNATDKVGQFLLKKRRAVGTTKISNRTANYYLTAVGAFCRQAAANAAQPDCIHGEAEHRGGRPAQPPCAYDEAVRGFARCGRARNRDAPTTWPRSHVGLHDRVLQWPSSIGAIRSHAKVV
jgi:hypothetical protein